MWLAEFLVGITGESWHGLVEFENVRRDILLNVSIIMLEIYYKNVSWLVLRRDSSEDICLQPPLRGLAKYYSNSQPVTMRIFPCLNKNLDLPNRQDTCIVCT